jgi:acyl CoA:acetate/3-ketoacid CoA transferase alpha subunit
VMNLDLLAVQKSVKTYVSTIAKKKAALERYNRDVSGRAAATEQDLLRGKLRAGAVEGGFILRDECISRVIKFDSKQKNKTPRKVDLET